MAHLRYEQKSFSGGEISPECHERRDLPLFASSLKRCRNAELNPQGDLERRGGWRKVAEISSLTSGGSSWNAEFNFGGLQRYEVIVVGGFLAVFKDGTQQGATLVSPWSAQQLPELNYTQALDTMLLFHPEVPTQKLMRQGSDMSWELTQAQWDKIPLVAYGRTFPDAILTPGATTGSGISFTTDVDWFTARDVGATIEAVDGGLAIISAFVSETEVQADIQENFGSTDPIPGGQWTFDMASISTPDVELQLGALTGQGVTFETASDYFRQDDVGLVISGPNGVGRATINTYVSNSSVVCDITADFTADVIDPHRWSIGFDGIFEPYVSIKPAAVNGSDVSVATDPAGTKWFRPLDVGGIIQGNGGTAVITKYVDHDEVKVNITTPFVNTNVINGRQANAGAGDWTFDPSDIVRTQQEDAWSFRRGYPRCGLFFQGRLGLGGIRDYPNFLGLSKSGFFFNFDEGEGLDDEAIIDEIVAAQVNVVLSLQGNRYLQVLTTGGVYSAFQEILTPATFSLAPSGQPGCATGRSVVIEGGTLYVTKQAGQEAQTIREIVYSNESGGYGGTDMGLLAHHLIRNPVDLSVREGTVDNPATHLFAVNRGSNEDEDVPAGSLCVLSTLRSQDVTGWGLWTTDGVFSHVCVVGGDLYAIVRRTIGLVERDFLEKYDQDLLVDCGITITYGSPTASPGGFDHLEGKAVQVYADEVYVGEKTVSGGAFSLDTAASIVTAGLPFEMQVVPIKQEVELGDGISTGKKRRLTRVQASLVATVGLKVRRYGSSGAGVPFVLRPFGSPLGEPIPPFTGYKDARLAGWDYEGLPELLAGDPYPARVRALVYEVMI